MADEQGEQHKRLHDELLDCFRVIDTCLSTYYGGAKHMYRPLAAQLRIVLCDSEPLLSRVFPTLSIQPLRPIQWFDLDDPAVFPPGYPTPQIIYEKEQLLKIARMPFMVTEYANGLQIADVEPDTSLPTLRLKAWLEQQVTLLPNVKLPLSIRDAIRSVADKGGGAHVDTAPGEKLQAMMMLARPSGTGVHQLLTVAFGRAIQWIGIRYEQYRERFGYPQRLTDVTANFNEGHDSVRRAAQVGADLTRQARTESQMMVVHRIA